MSRDEAGTTLVEVLVAVAIMAVSVVAIVQGMGTSVVTADHHAKQAQAHTVLVSAVEAVKSQSANGYVNCAGAGDYVPTSGVALPAGWAASAVVVENVQYWDSSAFSGTCPSPDQKLQLIRISVTSPDGRASESVSIVKRNPS